MRIILLVLILIPTICLSQETTVEDMLNAFNNLDEFKEKLFKDFPLDSNNTTENIVLEKYNYTIYKTMDVDIPYVLIADDAISIGINNELYLNYYDAFYKHLNEHCYVTMKQSPKLGLYDEWECESSLWMIKPLEAENSAVFFIKKKG